MWVLSGLLSLAKQDGYSSLDMALFNHIISSLSYGHVQVTSVSVNAFMA